MGSVGVAKQQSDQIDLSIFVDRSERSERVEKEHSQNLLAKPLKDTILLTHEALFTITNGSK